MRSTMPTIAGVIVLGALAACCIFHKDSIMTFTAEQYERRLIGSQVSGDSLVTLERSLRKLPTGCDASIDPSKVYHIVARHSGKALAVEGGSTSKGASIVQQTLDSEGTADDWSFETRPDGLFYVINANSDLAINVAGNDKENKANIIQWPRQPGSQSVNDEWCFQPVGDGSGYYYVVAHHSNKLIDIARDSQDDGANAIQWGRHGETNQQFKLVEVTTSNCTDAYNILYAEFEAYKYITQTKIEELDKCKKDLEESSCAPTSAPVPVAPTPYPSTSTDPSSSPTTSPTAPPPVYADTPAPLYVVTPAPVYVETPAPVDVATPAPLYVATPAPLYVDTPAPVAPTPYPSTSTDPSSSPTTSPMVPPPVYADTPAPVNVVTTAPVHVDAPAPVHVDAPAPVYVDTPAPVYADTPAPADTTLAPVDTTQEPTTASPTPMDVSTSANNGTYFINSCEEKCVCELTDSGYEYVCHREREEFTCMSVASRQRFIDAYKAASTGGNALYEPDMVLLLNLHKDVFPFIHSGSQHFPSWHRR